MTIDIKLALVNFRWNAFAQTMGLEVAVREKRSGRDARVGRWLLSHPAAHKVAFIDAVRRQWDRNCPDQQREGQGISRQSMRERLRGD
jgi:hypothetical protein